MCKYVTPQTSPVIYREEKKHSRHTYLKIKEKSRRDHIFKLQHAQKPPTHVDEVIEETKAYKASEKEREGEGEEVGTAGREWAQSADIIIRINESSQCRRPNSATDRQTDERTDSYSDR